MAYKDPEAERTTHLARTYKRRAEKKAGIVSPKTKTPVRGSKALTEASCIEEATGETHTSTPTPSSVKPEKVKKDSNPRRNPLTDTRAREFGNPEATIVKLARKQHVIPKTADFDALAFCLEQQRPDNVSLKQLQDYTKALGCGDWKIAARLAGISPGIMGPYLIQGKIDFANNQVTWPAALWRKTDQHQAAVECEMRIAINKAAKSGEYRAAEAALKLYFPEDYTATRRGRSLESAGVSVTNNTVNSTTNVVMQISDELREHYANRDRDEVRLIQELLSAELD